MPDFSGKHFGLLIAYVLPGFIALWGAQPLSPMIASWLAVTPTPPAGLASIVFVGLASVTAGMTVSAFRWLIVDTMHAWTGLPRPHWDDATLPTKLAAFEALVEAHFRHYQFYANSAVAVAFAFPVACYTRHITPAVLSSWTAAVIVLEVVFMVTSRDTLRKYYRRGTQLLGSIPRRERRS